MTFKLVLWVTVLIFLDQLVGAVVLRYLPEQVHWQRVAWYNGVTLAVGLPIAAFLFEWVSKYIAPSAKVLLLAGLLSNLLTYIFRGAVLDYVPVGVFLTNLADVWVIAGCLWASLALVKGRASVSEK